MPSSLNLMSGANFPSIVAWNVPATSCFQTCIYTLFRPVDPAAFVVSRVCYLEVIRCVLKEKNPGNSVD